MENNVLDICMRFRALRHFLHFMKASVYRDDILSFHPSDTCFLCAIVPDLSVEACKQSFFTVSSVLFQVVIQYHLSSHSVPYVLLTLSQEICKLNHCVCLWIESVNCCVMSNPQPSRAPMSQTCLQYRFCPDTKRRCYKVNGDD